MKLSVIIPVYNVERYLARCLDSVLNAAQGHDVEVICVNDGSTDGSSKILAQYADRVKIIDKENGGLGSARNAGLEVMTGDYVMFVDSDDWIPVYAISQFLTVAKESGAKLVVSMAFGKNEFKPAQGNFNWRMRPSQWIAGKKVQYSACNKIYHADVFKSKRYPQTTYEDFPITTEILCDVGEFAAIDEALYVYCINKGNSSIIHSPFSQRKLDDSIEVVRMVMRYQTPEQNKRFLIHQAADVYASTIRRVWATKNAALIKDFLDKHNKMMVDYPILGSRIRLKARIRLWLMSKRFGVKGNNA